MSVYIKKYEKKVYNFFLKKRENKGNWTKKMGFKTLTIMIQTSRNNFLSEPSVIFF